MRQRTLWALAAAMLAAACGGSNFTNVSDAGGGGDGGSSSSSGGSGSGGSSGSGSGSGSGSSSGGVGDSGMDAPVVACDGGLTSCGGKCVDTGNDPQNCGGCGVVCNTPCVAGVCPLIARRRRHASEGR